MKKEGWDFKETLENLAERAGVKLQPLTPQRAGENERNQQLAKLLEEAVVFYRYQLTKTDAGKEAAAYLEKRGIKPETGGSLGTGLRTRRLGDHAKLFHQQRLSQERYSGSRSGK